MKKFLSGLKKVLVKGGAFAVGAALAGAQDYVLSGSGPITPKAVGVAALGGILGHILATMEPNAEDAAPLKPARKIVFPKE